MVSEFSARLDDDDFGRVQKTACPVGMQKVTDAEFKRNLPLELVMMTGAMRGKARVLLGGQEQDDVSGFV